MPAHLPACAGSGKKGAKYSIHDSLEELARLADTANLKVGLFPLYG